MSCTHSLTTMFDVFNDSGYLNGQHCAGEVSPRDWPIYWATCISQPSPDVSYDAGIACDNSLGLSGMHELEPLWSAGHLDRSSAWPTPSLAGGQFLNSFPLPHFPLSSPISQPHDPAVHPEVAHTGVGETNASYLTSAVAENHPITMPQSRVNGPRQEAPPLRYTPYSLVAERPRNGDSRASPYQCQWSDGAHFCGAVVAHDRNAISHHLQTAHAIRVKADKTSQDCHWGRCRKSMRRESLPRHILAVHMREKVLCTDCDSRFARTDSLQRHQRTCCLVKGEKAYPTLTR